MNASDNAALKAEQAETQDDPVSALKGFQWIEVFGGYTWYLLLASLPVISAFLRLIGAGDVPYLGPLVFHFVVMLTAMAGSYTASTGDHLKLDLGLDSRKEKWAAALRLSRDLVGSFIIVQFFLGSLEMLFVAFLDERIIGIPIQVFVAFIPLGFFGILFHWLRLRARGMLVLAHAAVLILGLFTSFPSLLSILFEVSPSVPDLFFSIDQLWYGILPPLIPVLIIVIIAHVPLGLPLFAVLGGIGMLLFLRTGSGPGIILYEGYAVLDNSAISSIALFTLTGYLLSESKASERFIEVFTSMFGWIPGGMVIAAVLVSAVFTTFTGASGVTILALGGLLYSVLHGSGRYGEKFTIGLLTSSGSIGLLFPPSLAIILYGSVAGVNIRDLFLAGVVPGLILVLGISLFGIYRSIRSHNEVIPLKASRVFAAVKDAFWELLIPVVTLVLYFSGISSLLETSAIALIYTLVVELFIKKDFTIRSLGRVSLKSMRIVGGVLMILMLAKGLSAFIVDAGIPQRLAEFVQTGISSKIVFLLLLNLALLVTGTLMDIYSAIFVVVPLVLPLGEAFGINPLHLGIIFLANLELGFRTPPVGLNLFLSSYRFRKPLTQVYASIVPFLILQVLLVLIITFVPQFSLWLVGAA
ncbi:TRAP transporter large permease [Salinispira pacifica]|uniref:TRAP-type C4-dicarboxylate transport system, large permease component n=1 Tax=Salinispira pacifica TaxID=1307761 RepID=V5WGK1_9SPIO|nr:TRAP transporter large permease subunit [Salinispira pacifica]AHC14679.1 TRAP-type C4-dicarboxylate transport system, large permease component [Salinispira pacifica]